MKTDSPQLQLRSQHDVFRSFIEDCKREGDPVKLECLRIDCVTC